jgi:galactonate dehydratase
MVKVAVLTEAHCVPLVPHFTMSYLGLTASLHVAASVPSFPIHEGYENQLPEGMARKTWEMDADGYVSLPQGPGLGVEVDEQLVREIPADPSRCRPFERAARQHRDGAGADY